MESRLVSVTGASNYVPSMTYDSAGRLLTRALGNGLTQNFNYYAWNAPAQGGRLHTLVTGALQNMTYQYDSVGNITQIANSIAGETSVYDYDALDRLTSWQLNQDSPETYTYDAQGNLDVKNGLNLNYNDANHKHAVTSASNQSSVNSYQYDQNGNQTTREIGNDTFDLAYDAENRLVEVKKNSITTAQFTFDGDGRRVKSVIGSETILFAGGHYEKKGSAISKYYFAGASRIAMRKYTIPQNMSVEYFLGDHLGSASITTDANGVKVSEMRYKPWGELRYSWTDSNLNTTPTYELPQYTFTNQYSYVTEFGLMYYGARFYDVSTGRFVSADTVLPPGMQGLDRFAYVNNNPVRYNDPTGHVAEEENMEEDETTDVYVPEFTGEGWTLEEMIAIIVAYNLVINAFGGMDNFLAAFGGPLTFEHVAAGSLGQDVAARAGNSLNISIDSAAFATTGDKMTWNALHEMGHVFDWSAGKNSGDPKKYKSQVFVDIFEPGCPVKAGSGCSGSDWTPSGADTTGYGKKNSVEDFADSFASTILMNAGAGYPNPMTYKNVGFVEQTIINNWILYYAQ